MLWASILLPSLALDSALRRRPPVDQSFALVHGPAQQRQLLAVNALAHDAGLYPGQRLAEAEAICRDLLTAVYDPRQPQHDLALIAAWAYRWSSEVALDPPRTVALEIGKSLGLFGPWAQLETRLRTTLAALGFHMRIALAPNPHAARVLASAHDGASATTEATLLTALAHTPVTRAGLPTTAAQALPRMGLHSLGQVLSLPRAALQRRFGAECVSALDHLLGNRPHGLAYYRPPDRFAAHIELPAETTSYTTLLFPLKRMLADLAAFVAARDSGVQQFNVRLRHEDAAPTDIGIGLLAPAREATALFEVAKLRLEQTRLPAPVRELEIRADTLPPFVPAGRDLFAPRPQATEPWTTLRERLRARLGVDAVHAIKVDPDPRPERATTTGASAPPQLVEGTLENRRERRQVGGRRNAASGAYTSVREHGEHRRHASCQAQQVIQGSPRPTWLLARPIPLRGPMPRVLAGPERLETGWWDGDDIRRDYYVLELTTGQRAWAFCAPGECQGWSGRPKGECQGRPSRPKGECGPFMLHGWFA